MAFTRLVVRHSYLLPAVMATAIGLVMFVEDAPSRQEIVNPLTVLGVIVMFGFPFFFLGGFVAVGFAVAAGYGRNVRRARAMVALALVQWALVAAAAYGWRSLARSFN